MSKKLVLILLAISTFESVSQSVYAMEETITYGVVPKNYNLNFWVYEYEPYYYNTFARDLGLMDDRQERADAFFEACSELIYQKPAQCTSDPGPIESFVPGFLHDNWTRYFFNYYAYLNNVIEPALVVAANDYRVYQNAPRATSVFADTAYDICVNGEGADIVGPAAWPVSNEVACIVAMNAVAEEMEPDFTDPLGNFSVSLGIELPLNLFSLGISAGLDLGPWGNTFFEELTASIKCHLWNSQYKALGCY